MQGLVSEQGADLASTLLRQLLLYRREMHRLLRTYGRDEDRPVQAEEEDAAAAEGAGGQAGTGNAAGAERSSSKGTSTPSSGSSDGKAAAKAEQAARNQKRFNAHMP